MSDGLGVSVPRVLVPRPAGRAARLCAALEDAGFEPCAHPFIDFSFADAASISAFNERLARGGCAHLVVTSKTTVRALSSQGNFAPHASVSVVAVGRTTAAALDEAGVRVDHVAEGSGEALVASFPHYVEGPRSVAYPVSAKAGPTVKDGLRHLGWDVERFDAYAPVPAPLPAELPGLIRAGAFHALLLTSPYIADLVLAHRPPDSTKLIAIGKPTAQRIQEHGYRLAAQAEHPYPADLVTALRRVTAPLPDGNATPRREANPRS